MTTASQIVISASRRTDIPAFYMDWFMSQVHRGWFEVTNPFNRKVSVVPATPDRVHTIVFWSKNFGPFIDNGYGDALSSMGYRLFFNFTINSDLPLLEPNVPSLKARILQLSYLCEHYPIESINWRFDPICYFKFADCGEAIQSNLMDFQFIAQKASQLGVRRCITSFMDDYAKIRKRTLSIPEFAFIDPSLEKKKTILLWMKKTLDAGKIKLHTCCEREVLERLPTDSGIGSSSCIPNDLLVKIFGGHLSLKKDSGQRTKMGCGCMTSVDIGSYQNHPCYHNCLFCYANPTEKKPMN